MGVSEKKIRMVLTVNRWMENITTDIDYRNAYRKAITYISICTHNYRDIARYLLASGVISKVYTHCAIIYAS